MYHSCFLCVLYILSALVYILSAWKFHGSCEIHVHILTTFPIPHVEFELPVTYTTKKLQRHT